MANAEFRSALGPEISRFLEFKEASTGNANDTRRWYMRSFDAYCAKHGHETCSKEAVEGWGAEIEQRHMSEVRSWIGNIREFARYLRVHGDPDAYILSENYKHRAVKPKPYLLSQDELDAFFDAACSFKLRNVPWQWQAHAFFGLMHSCGLRTIEARKLKVADINLGNQTLDVIGSKGSRDRRLYINDEISSLLEECMWRTKQRFDDADRHLFVSNTGRGVCPASTGVMFGKIWRQAGLPLAEDGKKPRPYDLRHHFAYANIERWAAEGKDVNAMLPYLARYMGHSSIESTLYYVHTSPDFMAGYAHIVRLSESVLPEVGFDD